ncbi:hypothetical protein BJY52DRAFT_1114002, partial [Lactarius psammicola]
DGFLFCVHRYLFSHDSLYFSNRFTQLGVRDHEALSTIVSLGDVECEDFEAFLSVLYPHFEEQDLSYEQWRSVLHLSTRWGFASRRRLALESIKPPTSYDRLLLARKYAVDHWVIPALTALCERTAPLSLDEARRMNIEDVVLVATVREDIFRSGGNATEIPRRVEAMQAEVLVRFADDDESLASSTSGATEQGPGSTVNATISSDSEARSRNDTHSSRWQMSPTASGAPRLPSAKFGAKHTSLPRVSEGGKTPRGEHATPDDSFIRHDAYFFKDGNATFLVDGMLYCVHRYFFSRDSVYFSTRFAQLGVCDHEALPTIISIGDIEHSDFEALLSVLYPANFEAHGLSYEQWKSVLHLSTRWGFASLRKLAIKSIKPPTPHDQFVLARTYSVDHWVLPALTALCERTLPLSLYEARQMSMEDVILVATVREEIRGGSLRSGTTGQYVDSTMASGVNPNVEAEGAKTIGVASPLGLQQMATKETDTDKAAEDCTGAKEDASKGLEESEVARAKEKADSEARNAGAEAKAKHVADLKAKAKAEARALAKVGEKARKKQEEATRTKVKADAEAKKAAKRARRAARKAKKAAKAKADAKAKKAATSRAHTTEPAARPASFLGVGTGESETPDGSRQQNNDSFLQHNKYFFKDGNVTFLVDGFLYCVHRYFFSRDSLYFSTRFAQLGVRDHEASSTIVSLGDVECKDFEAFLSVLYPENFEEQDLSYEQWRSVLHLSTRWGFASLRKLALRSIKPPTASDRLLLARTYAVDHWIVPALTALCERTASLSLDEAHGMSMEDVVLVATIREDIRSKAIRSGVSAAEISRRVEVMQAGTPVPDADNEVSPESPTHGATEQWPSSTVNATIFRGFEVRSGNDTETVVAKPVMGNTPMSGWKFNFVSSGRR